MSSTDPTRIGNLLQWLGENAFWNETLEIRESKYGIGVFGDIEKLQQGELLLRVPKCNVLSPKNSFIYNLIFDHQQENPECVEVLSGMNLLILCVIYELSIGEQSPWYNYLISIENIYDENTQKDAIPISLWDDEDKRNLKNTQLDLFGLLDSKELLVHYEECAKFARSISHLVQCPWVFDIDEERFDENLLTRNRQRIMCFGKAVQIVNCRAFMVDEFYDLSLVPAADLFNHIHSVMVDDKVKGQENVHFVCDSNACEQCGVIDCGDHISEETEDLIYDEDLDSGSDVGEENDANQNDLDDRHFNVESEIDPGNDEESEESEIEEIRIDYIQRMEREMDREIISSEEEDGESDNVSEASTVKEEEELSTVSVDDKSEMEAMNLGASEMDEDLKQELSDSSKCCDMVLVSLPSEQYSYEIFNSYHQKMANPFLLDRYGFITERNPNDFVTLSVEFMRHVKQVKTGLSERKKKQLEDKIDWLSEYGFQAITQILSRLSVHDNEDEDDEDESQLDSVWEYSIRLSSSGKPSDQTYIILKLLSLPYKVFSLLKTEKEHLLLERVQKYLFDYNKTALNEIIKDWCNKKLIKYSSNTESPRIDTIRRLVRKEQDILVKFVNSI